MNEKIKHYAAWGAFSAVALALSVETGAIRSRPFMLLMLASTVGIAIYRAGVRKFGSDEQALPTVNQILRIAREHKGRITTAEVLAASKLELDEVRRTLDELAYAGTCQLIIGEKGTQVYYFPEFETSDAKEDSQVERDVNRQAQAKKERT